jgi:hypothetical protein
MKDAVGNVIGFELLNYHPDNGSSKGLAVEVVVNSQPLEPGTKAAKTDDPAKDRFAASVRRPEKQKERVRTEWSAPVFRNKN